MTLRISRALSLGSLAVIAFFVAVNLADLVAYLTWPSDYEFGSEVGGPRYNSASQFLGWTAAVVALAAIAALAPWFVHRKRLVVALQTCIAAAMLFAAFYFTK